MFLRNDVIFWKSQKLKQVANSPLAAETTQVVDSINTGCYAKQLIYEMTGQIANMTIPTDSKSLVSASRAGNGLSEKRLCIDFAYIKDGMDSGNWSIDWVNSMSMLADPLTKDNSPVAQFLFQYI